MVGRRRLLILVLAVLSGRRWWGRGKDDEPRVVHPVEAGRHDGEDEEGVGEADLAEGEALSCLRKGNGCVSGHVTTDDTVHTCIVP